MAQEKLSSSFYFSKKCEDKKCYLVNKFCLIKPQCGASSSVFICYVAVT
jgi:hypothetical protein